jgi:short-subunit dehydrogenase
MAEKAIAAVMDRFGPVDVLINNAGTITVGPAESMTGGDYQESLETHFWGAYHMVEAVLPEMRRRRFGRIVNISSIGGKVSVPHLLPYSVGKFALTGYSEGLRSELLRHNIYVTTVCPGLMRTGSPRNAYFKGRHRKEYAWFSISDAVPLASICAERAARRIVEATVNGDSEIVLSVPAKIAVAFHGLFPGATADLLGIVNRILPSGGKAGSISHTGRASFSRLSPSWITTLDERAARNNNEAA